MKAMVDAMLAAAPVGAGFLDREFRYVQVNERLAAMNGIPVEAHLGRTVRDLHPSIAPTLEPLIGGVLASGKQTAMMQIWTATPAHPDECRCRQITYFPVPGDDGEVALVGVFTLEGDEPLLRQMLQTLPVGVWILDAEGTITHANPAARRIWGGARFVGPDRFDEYKGWWTATGEAIAPEEWSAARAIRKGETSLNELITIQTFDGVKKNLLTSTVPLRGAEGQITGAIVVNEDVTELRRAEIDARSQAAVVQRQLADLEGAYASAPVGLCILDRELRFLRVNDQMAELDGIPASAHLGHALRDIVPGLADRLEPALRRVLETGLPTPDMEFSADVPARSGGERSWLEKGSPLRDPAAAIVGINVVANEITGWKRAEAALRRVEQLEAVGRLAGGIAHEANNQMSVVLGALHFIEQHDLPDAMMQDVHLIRTAAERTALITRQLLAFGRRQMIRPQVVSLSGLVRGFEPALARTLGEGVTLECRLSDEDTTVRIDPRHFEEALLTLMLNARDAMPDGGRVVIETARECDGSGRDRQEPPRTPPTPYIRLVMSDTGHGMEREVLDHIFEPFLTTKPVGSGTGLGLSMVYGIVKQAGGYIWAESAPGEGASFEILLPAAG